MKLLAIGLENRVVMYDVGRQKIRKEFGSLQHCLTCLAVSPKDSHVAVGCNDGTVQLINAISGVISTPILSNKLQYIECLKYQQSTIAGCTDSGVVALWDANANKLVHSFAHHRAPATGLVFSPINSTFGRLLPAWTRSAIFYDVHSKQRLSAIKLPDPISAST